ncbi:MAG: hypothetical protein ACXVAY_09525 [Mucilaginibacter sp.]
MKIKNLFFIVVFLSCAFKNIPPGKHITASPNIDGLYKFTGKLNGKYPVFLWFVVKDSVLKGEVTYLKTAKREPITIIGEITKADRATRWGTVNKQNIITIYEFTSKGDITGMYEGEFNTNSLSGIWGAPGSEKQLPYNLLPKDTVLAPVDMSIKPLMVNGTYEYHWGKKGASGVTGIKQTSPGNYLIEVSCVTSPPPMNLANLETFKAKMIGNAITFKIPDEDCRYTIKLFNNFIVIDRINGSGQCGFGLNADINGVFIKTSNKAIVNQVIR